MIYVTRAVGLGFLSSALLATIYVSWKILHMQVESWPNNTDLFGLLFACVFFSFNIGRLVRTTWQSSTRTDAKAWAYNAGLVLILVLYCGLIYVALSRPRIWAVAFNRVVSDFWLQFLVIHSAAIFFFVMLTRDTSGMLPSVKHAICRKIAWFGAVFNGTVILSAVAYALFHPEILQWPDVQKWVAALCWCGALSFAFTSDTGLAAEKTIGTLSLTFLLFVAWSYVVALHCHILIKMTGPGLLTDALSEGDERLVMASAAIGGIMFVLRLVNTSQRQAWQSA